MLYRHICPEIIFKSSPSSNFIQINRPVKMNAINQSIVNGIIASINRTSVERKNLIISGTNYKSLSSGGDLLMITLNPENVAEFLRSLHHMFYSLSKLSNQVISLWTGYVIGSGAGLACSCRYRVAFPSSSYFMPENGIGLFPDVGASYFLSHHCELEIGLYLSLTGNKLIGADCYLYGLCNYYIPEDLPIRELLKELEDDECPLNIIKKYHREPSLNDSILSSQINDIKACFSNPKSVEDIYDKLEKRNNKWSSEVIAILNEKCPTSLKISFQALMTGKDLEFHECLEMEFKVEYYVMVHDNYNFQTGTKHKLKRMSNVP